MTKNYLLAWARNCYALSFRHFLIGFLFLGCTTQIAAQTIYALSENNLVAFDASFPSLIVSSSPISGVSAGQEIAGMDFRPNTGQLYALGYNATNGEAQLYTVDLSTGAATPLHSVPTVLKPNMGKIGFDFNPTVDRIRVTGSNNANYRLHPVTGLVAATDGSLAFSAGDLNEGTNPSVGAVAYTNSYIGAAATMLFNYDDSLNVFTTQIPPNNGTLNTIGMSGITVDLNDASTDLDIFFDQVSSTNKAFFAANTDGQTVDNLYTVNLSNGSVTLVGAIGLSVRDIAVRIDRTVPATITGHLVYALTGNNNLISFDSDLPGVVRSLVAVTGVTAGQVLAGMDSRPATGELFLLGYNSTSGEAQLYTLNPMTGVTTAVGTAPVVLKPGMGKVSVDFNPTVDRIRVTGSDNSNYRLNPITGGIAATDGNLAFAAGDPNAAANPSIGAVAYSNSFIGATTTTLFNYDDSLNVFTTQIPPNNGVLNTILASGITVNLADPTTDLDVFFDAASSSNKFYFVANVGTQTADNFYTFSPASGLSLVGKVGLGIPVHDIAVAIDRTVPATITGHLVYALTGNNNLISFDSDLPGVVRSLVTVTGVTAGQVLSGMDSRPATGELFVLGYNGMSGEAQLYTLNPMTGVTTAVGTAPVALKPGMGKVSVDFNPTVDRIRVTGSDNSNYRLNPITGGIAATDGNLAFAAGDPNAAANPSIGAVAYSNSFIGATTTTLFNYDDSLNVFTTQIPPNNGVLNTILASGITVNLADPTTDLDVFFDAASSANKFYFVANVGTQTADNFYTFSPSGGLSLVGKVGLGIPVHDIAVAIDRTVPATITGHLVYALTGNNNLISFDSDLPGVVRSLVAVTGVTAGQVLAGMDSRPATGELFVLGYNSTSGDAQLYTLNPATGVTTAVGTAPVVLKPGMGKVSVDFNPTVDRIRVTGSDNSNYRLNPITGGIAATDGNLAFAAGDPNAAANPSIGAVAYSNSFIGTTTTTLFNYDDSLNVFTTQIPPNNGVLNTILASGITVNLADPTTDLDVFFDAASSSNKFYFVANVGTQTADNFYTFSPTGGLSLVGKVGLGIPVHDIAVAIDRAVPATITGHLVYALTGNNNLISFDSDLPGVVRSLVAVTGVAAGQVLAGMDSRPATGELFVLGYNSTSGEAQLYTLNPMTGVTTAVGTAPVVLKPGMGKVSVDFNPTVDRIRVTGSDNSNYRLNPITGGIAATDGNLAFAAGDANAAANPSIGAVAYSNSFIGTTTTTLFNYDDSLNVFTTQIPPNNGVLNTILASGITVNLADPTTDLDVFFDAASSSNKFYFVANVGAQTADNFYTFSPTGGLSLVGKVGLGIPVHDIAVAIDRTVPATITGHLVYALTGNNNLISFDSDLPGVVRNLVPVTGVAVGQVLVGMDFRPATGALFALGYNSTTGESRLYTINLATGVATAVGTELLTLALGGGDVGFDFNPTVDRIRVVSANNANYRLNPITGGLAATDTNLAFAATDINAGKNPAVGAVAYINSYNTATTTTLYNYDDSLNVLLTQAPPNNGTLNTVGTTGIVLNPADPSVDLDIYYDHQTAANLAYLSANTGTATADNFYTINLATGAATLVGGIGLGIPVRDIAVLIDSLVLVGIQEVVQENENNLTVYPNPVAATAFINFELPASGSVQLVVTDLAGRRVTTILTAEIAAGKQQAVWNITSEPAGLYFIQLYVDNTLRGTQKVIVRK